MTYFDVLMLFVGVIILSLGIYFSIFLYKNEKLGLWYETVKNRKTLLAVSIISLVCGYIAAIYGMKNIVLSTLSSGIILLGAYFLMVAIFYRPNTITVHK